MTVIEINKRLYSFPEKWDEMTPRQVLQVFRVLVSHPTDHAVYLQLLKVLAGCSWWAIYREKKSRLMEYFYLCDFIFATQNLTRNPLPAYKGHHGPADNFDNLRMNEFAYSQTFYEEYRANEQPEALDKLVATLWRPGGGNAEDGDRRQVFKEAPMMARIKQVQKWPSHLKEAIYHWYGGCLGTLMEANADVFTGNGGEPALHGIVSVMRNVAKDGTWGDFEKVEMMYVKMFFLELKEAKHEAAQLEKASK